MTAPVSPSDPEALAASLRACVEAMRAVEPWIAEQPRRLALEAVARDAEMVLGGGEG